MWSIDPAVALSMYDSEWRGDEVQSQPHLQQQSLGSHSYRMLNRILEESLSFEIQFNLSFIFTCGPS